MQRRKLAVAVAVLPLLLACSSSHGAIEPDVDAGVAAAPEGIGFCCPYTTYPCTTGSAVPAGGWVDDPSACAAQVIGEGDYDIGLTVAIDSHGCHVTTTVGAERCPGLFAPDAGAFTPACESLNEASCLAAPGCSPAYDDLCCPLCTSGELCADCTRPEYYGCQGTLDVCDGTHCFQSAGGHCAGADTDCSAAMVLDATHCSLAGCVPAVAPNPDPGEAVCVPVTAESCTVSCRRLPPDCPTGTLAEGDGSCFTDRCIPAAVCQ